MSDTKISQVSDDITWVHGKKLVELAQTDSFIKNAYFMITGRPASAAVERLLNVLFSLSLDHGQGATSTMAARIAASSDVTLQQALIAALSAMGQSHGGATAEAGKWLETNLSQSTPTQAVAQALATKTRIPGFGHKILTTDERTALLLKEATELKLAGRYCNYALAVEAELEKQKGKKLPLNIDGAIAAVLLDLGIDWYLTTGFFIIGRLPGLMAHIQEQRRSAEGPIRPSEHA